MSAGQIAAIAFLVLVVVLVLRGIRANKGPAKQDPDAGLGSLGTGPTGDVGGGD